MPSVVQTPLPIDAHVAAIAAHVRAHRSAVIVAPPGSGKTTRVPPALAAIGRTILLQRGALPPVRWRAGSRPSAA